MRICGIEIPDNKHIKLSLQNLYGIGVSTANYIVNSLGIKPNLITSNLNELERLKIRNFIENNFRLGNFLKQDIEVNINKLKRIGCYRGLRHRRGLPVRGQRTRTNAHTRKYANL
ncbi:ribosomal protein uS13 [Candidatus Hodgkinia cicadicola]